MTSELETRSEPIITLAQGLNDRDIIMMRVNHNNIHDAEYDVLMTHAMNLLSTGHNT